MSNSDKITTDILESMSIIAQQTVNNAGYDKTIQATIVSCVDATIGKYRVKYQDGYWFAFTTNINTRYSNGTNVYVLVPNGNMNETKTILGTTKQLGINYINVISDDERYAAVGSNTVTDDGQHQLCSYKTETVVLYNADNEAANNVIDIDTSAISKYLQEATHFRISALVKTNLPLQQRYAGNYGIRFYLDFESNADEDTVTRVYTLDVDTMEGNPYLLTNAIEQNAIFEIDASNFIRIKQIELFTENFPNQSEEDKVNDIFISNLSFVGATILSQQELNGVSLQLIAKKGLIFNQYSLEDDTRTVQAQVRVLGKIVNNSTQNLPFYWFIQDVGVTSNSQYYSRYGGQGWKCLNSGKTVSEDPPIVDFNPGSYTFTVKKSEVTIKTQRYKCVVVYDGNTFSKEFCIYNDDASYDISVVSDKGTQFVLDNGYPTLTCNVDPIPEGVAYVWGMKTSNGTFISLPDQTDTYEEYLAKKNILETLENGFNDGSILKNAWYDENETVKNIVKYNELKAEIEQLDKVQFVSGNQIIHVNIKQITNFATFSCTVRDGNSNSLGTDSITLVNRMTSSGGYSLIINNGTQVFNYNEDGVSPTNKSNEFSYDIPALTFTLYDMNGQEVSQSAIKNSDVSWIVPNKNTMLSISDEGMINADGSKRIINGQKVLSYDILKKYFINKTDNTIELHVNYAGYVITANTNFTFTKEGQLGTNGTGLVAKIVACDDAGTVIDDLPYALTSNGVTYTYNFNHLQVQLWKDGQIIFNSRITGNTTQGRGAVVVWSILQNKYNSTTYDNSCFDINADNGAISASTFNFVDLKTLYQELTKEQLDQTVIYNNTPANIIKASITYDGKTYYATLPIIGIYRSSGAGEYVCTLKPDTGFRYAVYSSDGRLPQYDNHQPFTMKLTGEINGDTEDLSTSVAEGYNPTYQFGYLGSIYEDRSRISKHYFTNANGEAQKNQKWVKPISEYDGLSVTNSVYCVSHIGSVDLLTVIPVHFMLNKYGNAAINAWDGNSVSIDADGNSTILAPQVGAGHKEADNSFTGVVIGDVKKTSSSDKETGLFGYKSGARSVFLDANTGRAEFGFTGQGQIIIDPSTKKALLKSGNYSTTNKTGMQIDLSTPEIRFGSGNFVVNSDGNLIATGGGSIAGWTIGQNSLYKDKVGLSSDNSADTNIAFWAGNKTKTAAPFRVDFNGNLVAYSGTIGSGANKITIGKDSQDASHSAIYSGSKDSWNSNVNGFYLGTQGIYIGSNFWVTNTGDLTARSGNIAGWIISSNALKSDTNADLNNTTGVFLGTSGFRLGSNFKVTSSGALTAKSGTIANWTIGTNGIRMDSSNDSYATSDGTVRTDGVYLGKGGIRLGSGFHVNSSGTLYATGADIAGKITASSGTIGSCKINATSIESSTSGWKINSDGTASFKTVSASNLSMTGGTISGGSMTGGSISPGGVLAAGQGGKTLKGYFDTLYADKAVVNTIQSNYITADSVTTMIQNANRIGANGYYNKGGTSTAITYTPGGTYAWNFFGNASHADRADNADVADHLRGTNLGTGWAVYAEKWNNNWNAKVIEIVNGM